LNPKTIREEFFSFSLLPSLVSIGYKGLFPWG